LQILTHCRLLRCLFHLHRPHHPAQRAATAPQPPQTVRQLGGTPPLQRGLPHAPRRATAPSLPKWRGSRSRNEALHHARPPLRPPAQRSPPEGPCPRAHRRSPHPLQTIPRPRPPAHAQRTAPRYSRTARRMLHDHSPDIAPPASTRAHSHHARRSEREPAPSAPRATPHVRAARPPSTTRAAATSGHARAALTPAGTALQARSNEVALPPPKSTVHVQTPTNTQHTVSHEAGIPRPRHPNDRVKGWFGDLHTTQATQTASSTYRSLAGA
jgi:hypothetical protein